MGIPKAVNLKAERDSGTAYTALALLVAVGTLMYACKGQPEKDEVATAAMDGDLSRVKDLFAIVGTFDYHGAEYPPTYNRRSGGPV